MPLWISCSAFLSGAAALIYQSLWLRQFSLIFGSGTRATAALLAAFMAGLALGSAWIQRAQLSRIRQAYAYCEAGIAMSALASLPLLNLVAQLGPGWGGAVAALCILPATFLSGATLPLLCEQQSRHSGGSVPSFGRLYRLNTLGAAMGLLAAAFFLIPKLGMRGSMAVAAAMNFGAAGLASFMGKRGSETAPQRPKSAPQARPGDGFLMAAALGCGLSAFVLEVLWARVVGLVLGSSVYSFSLMLLALLCGLALGTWIYERLGPGWRDPRGLLGKALLGLGAAILLQSALFGTLPGAWMAVIHAVPASFASYQWLGFALCFASLMLVTLPQGLIFPLLNHLQDPAARAQSSAGRLYAFNTLGAIIGSLAAGFWLIPSYGLQAPFVAAALPPLGLGLAAALGAKPRAFRAAALAALVLALAPAFKYWRPWDPAAMSSGAYLYGLRQRSGAKAGFSFSEWLKADQLLFYEEGLESVVSVRENSGVRSLQVNGKTDASSGDQSTQRLVGSLPLALHPSPKKAMVIGWGSGCSVGSALLFPLEKLDCVEIEPATLRAAPFFESMNRGALRDPRLSLRLQDGRNFLLASHELYDAILSEPSNPWIKGVSSLFTLEYYLQVRSHLAKGGIFGQWFHYYNMGPEDLKNQLRTLAEAFPYAQLWIVPPPPQSQAVVGDLLLLASADPLRIDMARLKSVFAEPAIAADFRSIGIDSPASLALCQVSGREGMLKAAGPGPLNTDMRPILEFSAPRFLYLEGAALDALNLENFRALESCADELPQADKDPDFAGLGGAGRQAAFLAMAGELSARRSLDTRALSLIRRSLALDAGQARAWLGLGRLELRRRHPEEAAAYFEKAIALRPALLEAYVALGKMRLAERNDEAALEAFSRLAKKMPSDPEGWLGMGMAQIRLGRPAEAKASLRRCLSLDPGQGAAGKLLGRLEGAQELRQSGQ